MQVMHDRVMLKKIEPERKTSSGFFIYSDNESVKATVVKVGSGRKTSEGVIVAPSVAVGDVVLFNVGAAIPFTSNREEFLVVKEEDILVIIDKE
jgi:chaperonin GroES